jgi:two-component system sensor histidine kinase RcsD
MRLRQLRQLQATINNELYEIRQFRSQVASRTQIFIIRDQDREVLVNKKLKQAQRLYEKNQQGRAAFMQNIGEAFKQPLKALATDAAHLNSTDSHQIARHADTLVRLVDEIQLANMLENDSWKSSAELFSIQDLIDEVVPEVLPVIKRKGLQLLINNPLPANDLRHGDRDVLRRILLLLIQYAVTTTQIGKITLEVSIDESADDRLTFRILDTGEGVTLSEIDNLHFPFLNETQGDNYGKANPLTFWLCDQLARKLGGHLNIKARESLGTRYSLHVKMAATPQDAEDDERLLDDVVAHFICQHLRAFAGAVGDDHLLHFVFTQMTGNQFDGLPCAHQQNGDRGERFKDLTRQSTGGEGNGYRTGTNVGFGSHSLGDGE